MGVIMKCSLLERIRKRELYIIFGIGVLMILLCCTGKSSISIDGQELTGFQNRLMIFHILVNAFSCMLSVVLSMRTIPNEYERRNSHLVWIRGISQPKYHGSLCIANCIVNMVVLFVFYIMLAVFLMINGHGEMIPGLIPAYFITCLNVWFICVFTSVLSIKVPLFITGLVSWLYVLIGIFHPLFISLQNISGGVSGKMIGILLKLIPDLHSVQSQSYHLVLGEGISVHKILAVLLSVYIVSIGILIFKKEEA